VLSECLELEHTSLECSLLMQSIKYFQAFNIGQTLSTMAMDMARVIVNGKAILIFISNHYKVEAENVLESEYDCKWDKGLESVLESWIHHAF
jgi:O-acetylhomoserine/O-acetylserine sulfhydrylase-like pyridoxal-dependent enzyme